VAAFDFQLHAAGALAPGVASLEELRAIARGSVPYAASALALPPPALLPPQERRRSSQAVRLVLACVEQAMQASPFPAESLRSVFASDEGTGEVCQQMLEALATTRQVSPLVFSNSVLNAPSGYFSIAWRNREPATVVSLGMESFASGLFCAVLEAMGTDAPVLLVNYDPAMPAPINELIPVTDPMANAWIISRNLPQAPVLASFRLALETNSADVVSALPAWMPEHWAGHASAQGLAALTLLEAPVGSARRFSHGAQSLSLTRVETP
jgi:hypothetical protein